MDTSHVYVENTSKILHSHLHLCLFCTECTCHRARTTWIPLCSQVWLQWYQKKQKWIVPWNIADNTLEYRGPYLEKYNWANVWKYPLWTVPWNIADSTWKYHGPYLEYNWADTQGAIPHSTSGLAITSSNMAKNVRACVIIKGFVITNKWVSSNRTISSVISIIWVKDHFWIVFS